MSARLLVTDPIPARTFELPLTRDATRIGRAADRNDVVLDDSQVSREHALIRRAPSAWVITDLNSANGTFVNGKRVHERALTHGDSITVGKYIIQYQEPVEELSVRYDDDKVGRTIVLRRPEQIAADISSVVASPDAGPASPTARGELDALRKKAETLVRLYELNRMLGSVFALEDIFKKVSEMFFRLSPADRLVVLLRDETTRELLPVAAESRDGARPSEQLTISRTVVDHVVGARVSLLSYDTRADRHLAAAQSIIVQNIRSVMCAPLLGGDAVLGVIYLDCQHLKGFSEDDLDLLNALAAETSIAVENAITHRRLVREELARANYRRFMPPHVVDEILANPGSLSLGGRNTPVTALFSDVRNFTALAERLPPETVVQMLNQYFADMTPIVFEHRGLLDKYMGDGLMALFGVPYDDERAAVDAVAAAIAMQRRMAQVNEGLKSQGLAEIAIGIGINTGMATVGYIGSQERTDYTAIGDTINLAARLEKRAGPGQILVTRATCERIAGQFPVEAGETITVKGKRDPVQVYEVVWRSTSEL